MGANKSYLSKDLGTNEYLMRLASSQHISPNDPFWNQLLSFSFDVPKTDIEQRDLEKEIVGVCKEFVVNNVKSCNLGSLIRVFLRRASELHDSAQCHNDMFTWQSGNALFIIRQLLKYLVENTCEAVFLSHFTDLLSPESDKTEFIDLFVDEFYCILIHLPILKVTHSIHLELLNILITMLSLQIFQAPPHHHHHHVYRILMHAKCSLRSVPLLQRLLSNYIDLPCHNNNNHGAVYNLTSAIGSGLWSVVTLGMGAGRIDDGVEEAISTQSLLLLLILCNYFHSSEGHQNPYHTAFLTLTDESLITQHAVIAIDDARGNFVNTTTPKTENTQTTTPTTETTDNTQTTTSTLTSNKIPATTTALTSDKVSCNGDGNNTRPSEQSSKRCVKLQYGGLFRKLCTKLHLSQHSLLLYMLMHHNTSFRAFVLSRTDIEQLVLPVLEVLYTCHHTTTPASPPPTRSTRDLYIFLIILLLLTQDCNFCQACHDIQLNQVAWLSEHRQVGQISLGSLILLVLIRTIQFNMSRIKDQYLQTNCLGALANMSSQFKNIHPYVAQKLCTLFALMLKKHKKLSSKTPSVTLHLDEVESESFSVEEDCEQEVLEELMRMMLEVFNSCLSHSLKHNPHLIYCMLYQRDLFTQLSQHPNFHDVVFNIHMVLNFFSAGLEKEGRNLSVSQVQHFISLSGLHFKKDRLKKFADLSFQYVEEERPEEFFLPYTWTLVLQCYSLNFNTNKLSITL